MDITKEAQGRWGTILPALGIPSEWMTKTGKPCLMCNGHDRSSYDDLEGRGTYICRGCGSGDGFSLLMKYHGWDFPQTAREVEGVLGVSQVSQVSQVPRVPPAPKEPKTLKYALELWKGADTRDSWVSRHPYARKKRIGSACGAGRGPVTGSLVGVADCIIVPSRDHNNVVVGVECINPDGVKQSFGIKSELILGTDLDPLVPCCVFEGWASAVKWLDSRRWNAMAVVSFGNSRQRSVGESIEQRYPNHAVISFVEVDS